MHTNIKHPKLMRRCLWLILFIFTVCRSTASELTDSIQLENGQQLTAGEVEYVLIGGDIGDRYDRISAKIISAGSAAVPLYREVLQHSTHPTAVAVALHSLRALCGDIASCSADVSTVAARGDMMSTPVVRRAFLLSVEKFQLASQTETIRHFLDDKHSDIRYQACLLLAQLGDASMLTYLESIAPEIRKRELEDMEQTFARAQEMMVEAGLDVESLRAREQEQIESRYRAIQTAVQELRERTIDEPEQESAPAETAVPPTTQMEQSEKRETSDVMASQPEVRLDSAEEPKDSSVDESDPGPLPGSVLWAVVLLVTVFSIWLLLALRRRRVE